MTPAATNVLTYQYNAVLFALVNGTAGTRRHARRIQTVVAVTRQVLHKNIVELQRNVLADFFQVDICAGIVAARQVVVPIRTPFDFHAPLRYQRTRACHGLMFLARRRYQRFVIVSPRLVVVIHFGLFGVIKQFPDTPQT